MRYIYLALILLLFMPGVLLADGGEISTTGEATVTVPPDNADVQIVIATSDRRPEVAAAKNREVHEKLSRGLGRLGYGADALVTVMYRVDPEYSYNRQTGKRTKVGYKAQHRIKVNTRDLLKVGELIDAALEGGASEISGVNYFSSKLDAVRQKALEQAVKRARSDAEVMASAAGGSLGELIAISSGELGRPGPLRYAEAAVAMAKSDRATSIVPDEISVKARVSARWGYLPGK